MISCCEGALPCDSNVIIIFQCLQHLKDIGSNGQGKSVKHLGSAKDGQFDYEKPQDQLRAGHRGTHAWLFRNLPNSGGELSGRASLNN